MLAGLKALLEHNVGLNLTLDRYPKGNREAGDRKIGRSVSSKPNAWNQAEFRVNPGWTCCLLRHIVRLWHEADASWA
jgi:hypothetical protein